MGTGIRAIPAALVLAAGAAAALGDFTFTPQCVDNPGNWYQECSTTPCGGGGYHTYNNWGYTNCSGSLPTPGPGQAVHIGGYTVYQNGAASIASLDMTAGGSLHVRSDLTLSGTLFNTSQVVADGGNLGLTGTVSNSAPWVETSGYYRGFNGLTFTNNASGTLEFQALNWGVGSGGGVLTNNGTIVKTTGNGASSNIPMMNNAVLNVNDGSLTFYSMAMASAAGASYTIAAAGGLYLQNVTASGTFNGTSAGTMRLTGDWGQSANVTFNIQNHGLEWAIGNFSTGAFTMTNAPTGIISNNSGNSGYAGVLNNQGTYYETNGYSRQFANFTYNNSGTTEWQAVNWNQAGGTAALFNNSGTVRKVTGNGATIALPVTNSGVFNMQDGGTTIASYSMSSTSGASYTVGSTAGLYLQNESLTGTFNGTCNGLMRMQGDISLSGNLTMNIANNGWEWSGGTLSTGAFTNQRVWSLTAGNCSLVGTFVSASTGTMYDSNGYSRQFNGATVTNSGAMNWQSLNWNQGSGTNLVTNNGTITKTTGNTGTLAVPFVNNGSLSVQDGGLNLATSVQSAATASYPVGATGTLAFVSSTLRGTFNGVNNGSVQWQGSDTTLAANTTFNITGNGLTWTGGGLNTAGFTLTNTGIMTWVPGNVGISGTVVNAAGASISDLNGYSRQFNAATITNNGTLNWQNLNWNQGSGTNGVTNNGTITKTTGNQAALSVPLVNNGVMSVQDGTLILATSVQSAAGALYPVGINGTLAFDSATVQGTFTSTNSGTVRLQGSGNTTLSANTTFNVTGNGLTWTGGGLNTAGFVLTNTGIMTWVPGNTGMSGRMTNAAGATITDVNGYSRQFDGFALTNNGTVNWQNLNWNTSASGGAFVNAGTVTKTTGNGANEGVPMTNTGLVNIQEGSVNFSGGLTQTAGTSRLSGGSINGGTLTLQGGRLEGNGTVQATVNNTGGVVAPGLPVGAMSLNTNYAGAAATFEVDLAGNTPALYDHLQVNGNATLNGTLRVVYNGTFNPIQGSSFRILDVSGTRTGTFSNIQYVNRPFASAVAVQYDAHGATITITQRCGSADFNGDGDIGTDQDIEAFFRCLAGNCCATCEGADFNFDGDIGTDQDIEAFFRVLAGSAC